MNNDVTIRVPHLGGKIICDKCGEYFGCFKIYPDWYGGRHKNKYIKNNKCVMGYLYDHNINQAINAAPFAALSAKNDLITYVSKITGVTNRKLNKVIKEMHVDFVGDF